MELEDQLAALSLDANDFALSDRPSVLQDGFVDKRFKKIIDRLIQIQQQGSFGPCVECDRRSDVDTAPVWPRNALVSALYKLRNTIPLTAVVQHIIIANSDWNSKPRCSECWKRQNDRLLSCLTPPFSDPSASISHISPYELCVADGVGNSRVSPDGHVSSAAVDTWCYQLINTLLRSPHQQDVDGECADHTIDSDDPMDRDHIVEVQVLKRACYEVCHLLPLLDLVTLTIVANSDWNTQALHPGCNKNKGAFFKHHLKHGFFSDRKVPGTWRLNACRKESLSDALKLMCTECNTDALEQVIWQVEVVWKRLIDPEGLF